MGDSNWNRSTDRSSILSQVLLDYQPIAVAPHGPNDPDVDIDQWRRQEATKRYKAADRDGNVYLVMNPAAWPVEYREKFIKDDNGDVERNGERGRICRTEVRLRIPPKRVFTFAEAKKASESSSKAFTPVLQLPTESSADDMGINF